jgi:hypothetical protein
MVLEGKLIVGKQLSLVIFLYTLQVVKQGLALPDWFAIDPAKHQAPW